MLNLVAFRLLSNTERIPHVAVRLLLSLMCDFDLAHFRAISLPRLVELYGLNEEMQARRMKLLLDLGLLETGMTVPDVINDRIVEVPTYRIPDRLLLTKEDLAFWDREIRAQRDREALQPAAE
jgi:hypothetical protein